MKVIIMTISLFMVSLGWAEDFEIVQKDKAFSLKEITVKKGDSVNFINSDDIFHNVFSLSENKFFDLGSYPKGESRAVIFDRSGEVEVECAIHPQMYMKIMVEP